MLNNISDRVEKFLQAFAEQRAAASRFPVAPGYMETSTSAKVEDARRKWCS